MTGQSTGNGNGALKPGARNFCSDNELRFGARWLY